MANRRFRNRSRSRSPRGYGRGGRGDRGRRPVDSSWISKQIAMIGRYPEKRRDGLKQLPDDWFSARNLAQVLKLDEHVLVGAVIEHRWNEARQKDRFLVQSGEDGDFLVKVNPRDGFERRARKDGLGDGDDTMDLDAGVVGEADIRRQVEYYFSDRNLEKDVFLRGQIAIEGCEGWVDMAVVITFPKLKAAKVTKEAVLEALQASELETRDAVDNVRAGIRRPGNRPLPELHPRARRRDAPTVTHPFRPHGDDAMRDDSPERVEGVERALNQTLDQYMDEPRPGRNPPRHGGENRRGDRRDSRRDRHDGRRSHRDGGKENEIPAKPKSAAEAVLDHVAWMMNHGWIELGIVLAAGRSARLSQLAEELHKERRRQPHWAGMNADRLKNFIETTDADGMFQLDGEGWVRYIQNAKDRKPRVLRADVPEAAATECTTPGVAVDTEVNAVSVDAGGDTQVSSSDAVVPTDGRNMPVGDSDEEADYDGQGEDAELAEATARSLSVRNDPVVPPGTKIAN